MLSSKPASSPKRSSSSKQIKVRNCAAKSQIHLVHTSNPPLLASTVTKRLLTCALGSSPPLLVSRRLPTTDQWTTANRPAAHAHRNHRIRLILHTVELFSDVLGPLPPIPPEGVLPSRSWLVGSPPLHLCLYDRLRSNLRRHLPKQVLARYRPGHVLSPRDQPPPRPRFNPPKPASTDTKRLLACALGSLPPSTNSPSPLPPSSAVASRVSSTRSSYNP